ncbi:MAG: DUF6541 family protein, partial [Candidatus Altiarchaeota archaeon]
MSTQKKVVKSSEDKVNFFIAFALILLSAFFLYSGGELLGFLTLLLVLFTAYRIVRHSFDEIYFEKLFLLAIGICFTIISIIGFTLMFLGFNLSTKNFFIIALLAAVSVVYLTREKSLGKVRVDKLRVLLVGASFFITLFVYLWPSLPDIISPCIYDLDCAKHIEYMDNIYYLESAVPPIENWRYYPAGFHINGALLTHALENSAPSFNNLAYPFAASIAAMIVAILSGMVYDRVKNKIYVLLFLALMLTMVYPVSALIGYGFWPSIFGTYYAVLFAWILGDFANHPKDRRMLLVLILLAIGTLMAYQILGLLVSLISFILATFSLVKIPFENRIKVALTFLLVIGAFYAIYTLEGYSRYLSYLYEPLSTSEYFADRVPKDMELNKGSFDFKLEGASFKVKIVGLKVEDTFVSPGIKLSTLLSKGVSITNIGNFARIGEQNLNETPAADALYFDLKWFGLLTILLMVIGLINSYDKR